MQSLNFRDSSTDGMDAVTTRVFHLLCARLALVSLAPAAVAFWAVGPLVGIAVGAAILVWDIWRVRQAVISVVPETMQFVPAKRSDHQWIDDAGFRTHLAELQALGFHPLADFHPTYPGAPKAFGRALVHPQARVYAEVNQVKDGSTPMPVVTVLTTPLTDGWSLTTTTREIVPTIYAFMRAPRAVWKCAPQMTIDAVFRDHVEQRRRLCHDRGLSIAGDGTMEGYVAAQTAQHADRFATVRSVNIVRAIANGLACERRPVREWHGGVPPTVTS